MVTRLLWKSVRGRKTRVALASAAVAVAAALASALLNVALDVSEKMAKELRAFGANVVVLPKQDAVDVEIGGLRYSAAAEAGYLVESDLPKLKSIFWGHNVLGFAPFLSAPVEIGDGQALLVGTWFDRAVPLTLGPQEPAFSGGKSQPPSPPEPSFRTGLKAVAPWWTVEGRWVEDAATEVMLGSALAGRLGVAVGDRIPLGVKGVTRTFQVAGIARTGGAEEDQVFVDLAAAQSLLGLPGKVDRVQVSALVKPDDALAIKGKRNPRGLSADEYERWYCSPYIDAVIYQIEEAFPGAQGKALRQVAEAEGGVLGRVTLTLFLVTAVAMVAASLGVMATMTTTVAERRGEIGLMKAIGAEPRQITRQLLLEAGLYGLLGGTAGAAAGCALARLVGVHVFHAAVVPSPVTVPFVIGLAVVVALLGAALPTRQAARLDPVCTLRGG